MGQGNRKSPPRGHCQITAASRKDRYLLKMTRCIRFLSRPSSREERFLSKWTSHDGPYHTDFIRLGISHASPQHACDLRHWRHCCPNGGRYPWHGKSPNQKQLRDAVIDACDDLCPARLRFECAACALLVARGRKIPNKSAVIITSYRSLCQTNLKHIQIKKKRIDWGKILLTIRIILIFWCQSRIPICSQWLNFCRLLMMKSFFLTRLAMNIAVNKIDI